MPRDLPGKNWNNLLLIREVRGWTQEQAAVEMGISVGAYRKYENGERSLNLPTLRRAMRTFGVDANTIIGSAHEKRAARTRP